MVQPGADDEILTRALSPQRVVAKPLVRPEPQNIGVEFRRRLDVAHLQGDVLKALELRGHAVLFRMVFRRVLFHALNQLHDDPFGPRHIGRAAAARQLEKRLGDLPALRRKFF